MLETIIGKRYKIISRLGSGGFGETYLAEDLQASDHSLNGDHCVVKHLKPQSTDLEVLQVARRLFNSEAEVLRRLGNHDRIPQLIDHFEEAQEFYLVQELIIGNDLSQEIVAGKKFGEAEVIALLQDVLTTLVFVHGQNVIHRDLKPQNLMRRSHDGKIMLIDFGAVKQIHSQPLVSYQKPQLTVPIGTEGYMSSEQASGRPRLNSDIFALGMIGLQAVTGVPANQLPIDPQTLEVQWRRHIEVGRQISRGLARVLDKMVCFDWRDRYQSATAVLEALDALNSSDEQTHILDPMADQTANLAGATMAAAFAPTITSPPKANLNSWMWLTVTAIVAGFAIALYNLPRAVSQFVPTVANQPTLPPTIAPTNTPTVTPSPISKAATDQAAIAQNFYRQGKQLFDAQRYDEAIAAYKQALQIQPNYYDAWYDLAAVYNSKKLYDQAIVAYDRSIQLQPNQSRLWILKGTTQRDQSLYQEALQSFSKAAQIDPQDSGAWLHQGEMLEALQRDSEAITAYDRAIQINPNYRFALEKRDRLRQKLGRAS